MWDSPYNAKADADRYAANLRRWASHGFIRGLAGGRGETLPAGASTLPSEAFHAFAERSLKTDASTGEERSLRERYFADVEAFLSAAQQQAVDEHHRRSLWGAMTDIAISITSLVGGYALIQTIGAFHPVTFVFLLALPTAFFMMSFAAKRVVNLSRMAFHAEAEEFVLPWSQA
ncbi:hypothetical protein G6L37_05830 [Agrobacterium rubi]|nr:hypothetical protein [Agrobacterium rubi]NTF24879.1 hypothetical protein [Agrobacterium rubi]